jgi:hypothetical protein
VDVKSGSHNVLVPDDLAVATFPILGSRAKLNSNLGYRETVGWSCAVAWWGLGSEEVHRRLCAQILGDLFAGAMNILNCGPRIANIS